MENRKAILTMNGEISGFGGDYEMACRQMLLAGIRWLELHPDSEPKFAGYKGIYGVIEETNKAAESLSSVVGNAIEGCTGAMHQAVISTVLYIRKHGVTKYVEEMNKKKASE